MNNSTSTNSNGFNSFSINKPNYGSREFLESNTLVGKFAFLILLLFAFIIMFRLGTGLIGWLIGSSGSPHFIDGMVDAKITNTFAQDPNMNKSKTAARSNNAHDGIEFTWSVWIFIDDMTYLQGQYRHIFSKGDPSIVGSATVPNNINLMSGMTTNNCPGLYLDPNTNNLLVSVNTYNNPIEIVEIDSVPINKWINLVIRCQNTVIDVYINGIITQSMQLSGVPKQNYGDVYTSLNGGFSGYISNLWYYSYALGSSDILTLSQQGPNMKMIGSNGLNSKKPDYLSLAWYFNDSTPQIISVANSTGLTTM
jgi:hypothetical protein